MTVSRRTLLKAGAASGALLLAAPRGALAAPLGPATQFDTSRSSVLFPRTRLIHIDLHNHTLYSDGDGDPALAFESMRAAGLDAAALTDHSTVSKALQDIGTPCELGGCGLVGIDESRWQTTREIADANNREAAFTAIRGFEWSSPTLGHMNVWFSETWIDPLSTNGNTTGDGLGQFSHQAPGIGPVVSGPLDAAVRALPTSGAGMAGMYDWLSADPGRPVLGGGNDAISGFNHPGREVGRFGSFTYDDRVAERMVSMEVFNRGEDYLFEGTDQSAISPLTDCLAKGWRVGLAGVTDEHGTDWGYPDGKGRTGLYVTELTRAGVREAMEARRFFATRLRGLRFGATANGVAMGSTLPHRSGVVRFELDIDRGTEGVGMPLSIQVLMTGAPLPTVVHTEDVVMPTPGRLISFDVPIDVENGRWVVLRVTDPAGEPDERASADFRGFGNALAYASPFYLDPAAVVAAAPAPATAASESGSTPGPRDAGAAGAGSSERTSGRSLAATGAPAATAGVAAAATGAGLLATRLLRRPGNGTPAAATEHSDR